MCIVKCDYNIGGLNEELTEFQHYDYISGFRDGVAEVKLNENGALLIYLAEKYVLVNMRMLGVSMKKCLVFF